MISFGSDAGKVEMLGDEARFEAVCQVFFSRYRLVNGYRRICTLMPPLARQQCACKKKQGHLQRRTKSPHLKRRSLLRDRKDTLEGVSPPFRVLEALMLCLICFIEFLTHGSGDIFGTVEAGLHNVRMAPHLGLLDSGEIRETMVTVL